MHIIIRAMAHFRLTEEERRQFRAEQTCSVTYAGLPRVHRIFL